MNESTSNSILTASDAPEGSPGWFARHFPALFGGGRGSQTPAYYGPTGTERIRQQNLTNPQPGIDPVVAQVGSNPITQSQAQHMREAGQLALNSGLGPDAGPGFAAAGTFVGQNAARGLRTTQAQELLASGRYTPDQVRRMTGVFQGPDEMWRREVSDKGANLIPGNMNAARPIE